MSEEQKPDIPLHRERLGIVNKDAQLQLIESKRKQLSRDMAVCFGTVEGRRALRHLMNICGWKKTKVGGNAGIGMDVQTGTIYNAARENVFIELIEFIPAYILRDVEYGVYEDIEL